MGIGDLSENRIVSDGGFIPQTSASNSEKGTR
jgi:hypothetical protein